MQHAQTRPAGLKATNVAVPVAHVQFLQSTGREERMIT